MHLARERTGQVPVIVLRHDVEMAGEENGPGPAAPDKRQKVRSAQRVTWNGRDQEIAGMVLEVRRLEQEFGQLRRGWLHRLSR